MHHSHLQTISPVQTSTNWSRQIYSINLSKELLKIILSPGWVITFIKPMVKQEHFRFSMISIKGRTYPNLSWNLFNPVLTHVLRIAAAPPFSGLRRFPQGRGFKQWTGDDSKALMKVCIVIQICVIIFNFITTTGISTRDRRICPKGDFAFISCILGVLLHSPAWHHWRGHINTTNRCSRAISSLSDSLWRPWYST